MTDLHTDPFILSARANLLALEDEKDRLWVEARKLPRDPQALVAYDAAVARWAAEDIKYKAMIRGALGL